MATAQLVRKETSTITEVNIEDLATKAQQSLKTSSIFFMKLLSMTISGVTYNYKVFPEKDYITCRAGNVPIKVLRTSKSDSPEAYQVLQWFKGTFDALKNNYLKKVVFALSTADKPSEVFETLNFKFEYKDNGEMSVVAGTPGAPNQHLSNVDDIVNSTNKLLSTSFVYTSTISPQPNKKILCSMKLYYREGTPDDYEPPFFQPSQEKQFVFGSKASTVILGDVETNWHHLGARVQSTIKERFTVRNMTPAAQNIQNINDITLHRTESESLSTTQSSMVPLVGETVTAMVPTDRNLQSIEILRSEVQQLVQKYPDQLQLQSEIIGTEAPEMVSPGPPCSGVSTTGSRAPLPHENHMSCPCGMNEQLPGHAMMCSVCDFWQHTICFGYLDWKEEHVCDKCAAKNPDLTCTDPLMLTLAANELSELCKYRYALSEVRKLKVVKHKYFKDSINFDQDTSNFVIEKMIQEGVIMTGTKKQCVNTDKLYNEILPKYFLCIKRTAAQKVSMAVECQLVNQSQQLSAKSQEIWANSQQQAANTSQPSSSPAQGRLATSQLEVDTPFQRSSSIAQENLENAQANVARNSQPVTNVENYNVAAPNILPNVEKDLAGSSSNNLVSKKQDPRNSLHNLVTPPQNLTLSGLGEPKIAGKKNKRGRNAAIYEALLAPSPAKKTCNAGKANQPAKPRKTRK